MARYRRTTDSVKHDYKVESDLCEMLSAWAAEQGWRVFPETGQEGYDLLLVASKEVKTINARPGDQIGVQAKLKANIDVVAQAMPFLHGTKGPHFHAVLVPVAVNDFTRVATRCDILVMQATKRERFQGGWRRVRSIQHELRYLPPTLRHYYDEPMWHPEVEILVPAGVKSPRRITPWKLKAVRLCLEAARRGYLTSIDFERAGVSMTNFKRSRWIEETGQKIGRYKKYRLVVENNPPHLAHPEVAERLRLDNEEDEVISKSVQKRLGES